MLHFYRYLVFGIALFSALVGTARADTQYFYTSDDFNSWTNTACQPACHITGSLTLAMPLLTGLNFADVTPLTYSFTDGITTWTDVNAPNGIFEFSTDAIGNITFWIGSLAKTQDPSQCDPGSTDLRFLKFENTSSFALNSGTAICATDTSISGLYDAENESSGMWTVSTVGGTPVPEPVALSLTLLGLLGTMFAAATRRRKHPRAVAAKLSSLGLAFLFVTGVANAQNVWNGPQDSLGSWSDKTQWSLGTSPNGSANIVIPVRTVLGDVSFTNSHTLTIDITGELNILSTTTITNSGSTAIIDNFGTLLNNGTLINEHNAALNNNSTGALINNGIIANQLSGTLNNAGVIENVNGGLITNDLSSTINNSTLFYSDTGGTLTNFGTISTTGHLQTFAGGTINNFGTVTATGMFGFIDNQGTLNNSGTLSAANMMQNSGTMNNLSVGTIIGSGENIGILNNFSGGLIDVTGIFVTRFGGTLNNYGNINSTGNLQTMDTGTINNFGTINSGPSIYLDNQGTLNNSGTIVAGLFSNSGTTNNSGTMQLDPSLVTFSQNLGVFNNLAKGQLLNNTVFITFDGGVLNNYGTVTSTALLQTMGTGTINNFAILNSGPNVYLDNQGALNNSGTIAAGLFSNSGTTNNSGAMTLNPGVTFSQNLGVFNNQAAGQLINNAALVNFLGGSLNNSGTFSNNGLFENQSGATVQNLGVMNNASNFANSGLFQIGSGGMLNNTGSIANVSGGSFAVLSGGTFNNSGSFLSDPFSTFGSQANSMILNTGTMTLGGNTVAIGGGLVNNGTITMVAGPPSGDIPIQPPAPPLLITSTGKLSGKGTVNEGLFGFGVVNQGVMAPGDPLGTFTIQGNYQQTSTGMLEILLGGTGAGEFSQLDITGSANLSGALDVELFAGFDPQAGEIFEILESGGINNLNFLSMLFPSLPDALFFKLDQEGGNLFLDVMQGEGGGTSVPEPGTGALLLGAIATMFCASLLRKGLSTPRT